MFGNNALFASAEVADRFVRVDPAEAFDYRSARYVIGYFNGRNRIVDSSGRHRTAKNQWSKRLAAIPLNLPPLKLIGLGALLLLGLCVAYFS